MSDNPRLVSSLLAGLRADAEKGKQELQQRLVDSDRRDKKHKDKVTDLQRKSDTVGVFRTRTAVVVLPTWSKHRSGRRQCNSSASIRRSGAFVPALGLPHLRGACSHAQMMVQLCVGHSGLVAFVSCTEGNQLQRSQPAQGSDCPCFSGSDLLQTTSQLICAPRMPLCHMERSSRNKAAWGSTRLLAVVAEVPGCRLQVAGCRFQVSGFRQVAGCSFPGSQVRRSAGLQVCRFCRFCRLAGFAAFAGLQVCRFCRFAGLQVLQVCRFCRFCRFAGLQVCRFAGLQVAGFRFQVEGRRSQVAGLQVCRFAGLQVCRLQVSGGRLQVSGFRFQVPGSSLQVEGCGFQVASFRFQIVGCRLQVAVCRLQVAGCRLKGALQVESCRLKVASCRLRVSGCGLKVAGCRLQVAGSRLQVAGCRLQVLGCRF